MQIGHHQQQQGEPQSFSHPSSTTSIDDVPYCCFCLAPSYPTLQCPENPSQLCATLINVHEESFRRYQNDVDNPSQKLTWKFTEETRELYAEKAAIDKHLEQVAPCATTEPTAERSCKKNFCDATTCETLNLKNNRTVTFAPSKRPPVEVISDVTQSDTSTIPHKKRGSFPIISTNIDAMKKAV